MKTNCSCGCAQDPYETTILERPRYFERQIITATEMNLGAQYWRDCQRRHNRLLHGWGVVCGARVCPLIKDGEVQPWQVVVQSGYILGPYGDEIVIDCDKTYDLRTNSTSGAVGDSCAQPPDPWCSDVYVPRDENDCLYVAVRYKEFLSRPVRVPLIGCGCEDSQCEYSRVRDGYEITALDECPPSHRCDDPIGKAQTGSGTSTGFGGRSRDWLAQKLFLHDCPACPPEPWVVLAKVCFESDGTITLIDNCACRRTVVSFADYWYTCASKTVEITEVELADGKQPLTPKAQGVGLKLHGSGFQQGAKVNLGEGFTIPDPVTIDADGKLVTVTVDVAADLKAGDYTITVVNPDCSLAVNKVTVVDEKVEISSTSREKVGRGKKK